MLISIKIILKNIIFLLNVFWIFSTELFVYSLFGNYSILIDGLTRRLAKSNILYVKVFQAFALNNNLIDDKINNRLLKFTDSAPWNESDIELNDLIEIANKYDLQLKYGYEVPINAGMISIVFKAYSKEDENKAYIIKMKRKNIESKLNDAIENLLFSLKIISFIPTIKKYQISQLITKNIEIIRHQTNFVEEVKNINKVRENCKYLKYIKIPNVVDKVTQEYPNAILMEYIDGMKINKIDENDYKGFAKQVVKFGVVTTIIHGTTHGDLHSGNILFIKDNSDEKYPYKVGIIDFGIIYNLNPTYRGLLFEILTQMFHAPPRESAEKILNSGIIEPENILKQLPKEIYEGIIDFTEQIIDETVNSYKKANQIQIYKFLSNLSEYLSRENLANLGIKPSDDFIKSQLVLAMAHGITLTLCKENYMTIIDEVINELFHTELFL
jgi:predicted unusual protein kinase regulating ubiquinone biosynthesis (AarF/ABC1/UbiB family)